MEHSAETRSGFRLPTRGGVGRGGTLSNERRGRRERFTQRRVSRPERRTPKNVVNMSMHHHYRP